MVGGGWWDKKVCCIVGGKSLITLIWMRCDNAYLNEVVLSPGPHHTCSVIQQPPTPEWPAHLHTSALLTSLKRRMLR